jgi:hypothetical protein
MGEGCTPNPLKRLADFLQNGQYLVVPQYFKLLSLFFIEPIADSDKTNLTMFFTPTPEPTTNTQKLS